MRESEVLGHLLAVRWSSPRSSRHVLNLRFGIRLASGHSGLDRNGYANPKLLH